MLCNQFSSAPHKNLLQPSSVTDLWTKRRRTIEQVNITFLFLAVFIHYSLFIGFKEKYLRLRNPQEAYPSHRGAPSSAGCCPQTPTPQLRLLPLPSHLWGTALRPRSTRPEAGKRRPAPGPPLGRRATATRSCPSARLPQAELLFSPYFKPGGRGESFPCLVARQRVISEERAGPPAVRPAPGGVRPRPGPQRREGERRGARPASGVAAARV